MKIRILFPAVLFVLFVSQALNGQISLLHTFNESVNWNGSIYFDQSSAIPIDCYYTTSLSNNSYNIVIYNPDYSIQSSQTFSFTPPVGYEVSSVSKSKKLFNDDENFEFLVNFTKIEPTYDNTRTKLYLIGQSGNLIKDFGMMYFINASPILHVTNNEFRLLVSKFDIDFNYQTEIYFVPGEVPSEVFESKEYLSFDIPYPNPSKTQITLPYQLQSHDKALMNIFNLQGEFIERLWIEPNMDHIILNVANYSRGEYIYVVNGISKKFLVR